MNNSIIQDYIFSIYTKLPHCLQYKRRYLKDVRSRFDYRDLSDISIFSANCIGGEIYSLLGIEFLSPLINVSINRDQFIYFCENIKEYLKVPIDVILFNGMCVGKLGGSAGLTEIEIRFPHDQDPQKVISKWDERCKRVNYDKLVLINDDKGLTEDDLIRFDSVTAFRKICFTSQDLIKKYKCCYQLKEYEGKSRTGNYNGKSLNGLWKFTEIWDFVSFLNGDKK